MKRSPGSTEFAQMAYDDEATCPLNKIPASGYIILARSSVRSTELIG